MEINKQIDCWVFKLKSPAAVVLKMVTKLLSSNCYFSFVILWECQWMEGKPDLFK